MTEFWQKFLVCFVVIVVVQGAYAMTYHEAMPLFWSVLLGGAVGMLVSR